MPDHTATQLALRAQAQTLVVATTGSTTLGADSTGYTRSAGSFVTDGFRVGMEVTPSGFGSNTAPGVVTAVSALALTVAGTTTETAASGRTLAVGLPSTAGWENIPITPVAGTPYIEERYVPATSRLISLPASGGQMEDTGLYVLDWYAPANVGLQALTASADALLALFAPGTALTVASGVEVRPRTDVAPFRGGVRQDRPGWAAISITIPWRLSYLNV